MTEIPDLSALLGGGRPQRPPTAAERAAAAAEHARQHAEQEEIVARLAHWAPVLCCCRPWPVRGNTRPPQEDCVIHGTVMMNACTGRVFLPGMPPPEDDHHD